MAKLRCSTCKYRNIDDARFSIGLCLNEKSKNFALRVGGVDSCGFHQPSVKDLSFGADASGDHALFIEKSRINGNRLDQETKNVIGVDAVYFRILDDGKETNTRGWIKKKRIVMFL